MTAIAGPEPCQAPTFARRAHPVQNLRWIGSIKYSGTFRVLQLLAQRGRSRRVQSRDHRATPPNRGPRRGLSMATTI